MGKSDTINLLKKQISIKSINVILFHCLRFQFHQKMEEVFFSGKILLLQVINKIYLSTLTLFDWG